MRDTSFLTATVVAQDLSILVCLVILAITPRAGRKEFLFLGLALLFSFITEVVTFVGYFAFGMNTNFLSAIGAPLITSSYFLFYRSLFNSKQIRSAIIGVLVIFLVFALINMSSIQGLKGINSYTFTFRGIALIVMSLTYFYVLIKELPTETITKLPMFWINTAILIYYSGTFFHYLLFDYLANVLKGDVVNTYTIKNSLGIIYYLILAVGLWHNRSATTLKSPVV